MKYCYYYYYYYLLLLLLNSVSTDAVYCAHQSVIRANQLSSNVVYRSQKNNGYSFLQFKESTALANASLHWIPSQSRLQ